MSVDLLDKFHESEMFNELCRARWREFKERLTKEQRSTIAEIDARRAREFLR